MPGSLFKLSKSVLSAQVTDGFTLPELLIAGALTVTAVGASGVGLASMLSSSSDSSAQNERRIELNRSLEFIAAEVRQAERIEPNAQDLSDAPGFNASNKQPVLTLKIPGVDQRVIYYVADVGGIWQGPKAIYRWGPDFNIDGTYQDANNPSAWNSAPQPLIDLISDEASQTVLAADADCQQTGWTANPPVDQATGFYSCVSPTGKIAKIFHKGRLKKLLGNSESYAIETKAFARPSVAPPLAAPPPPSGSPSPLSTPATSQSLVTISNLGGEVQCGPGNPLMPVTGTVELTPGPNSGTPSTNHSLPAVGNEIIDLPVPPNTTLTITGQFNYCGRNVSFNSSSDLGRQVLVLRDGQTVPPFNAYQQQGQIASFLTAPNPKNNNQPYLDPNTRIISLADNQTIFLFELGVDYDDSLPMNLQSAAFDMQDLVAVATVTPDLVTSSTDNDNAPDN